MAPREKYARIFNHEQKKQCWNNAQIIEGRDPNRWRYDAVGNPVLRCLTGCMGPLCHEYDHKIPYSKGGRTSPRNCQILQTSVNRYKSNSAPSFAELQDHSIREKLSDREMDLIEYVTYGNITGKK